MNWCFQNNVDEALEGLEQFVLCFYDISPQQGAKENPNLFFS